MKSYNFKQITINYWVKFIDQLFFFIIVSKSFFSKKKIIIVMNKSKPGIIHANGSSKKRNFNKLYLNIISKCKPFQKKKFEKLRENLSIVTWKGGYYSNKDTILEKSLRSYGLKPIIINYSGNSFWNSTRQSKIFNTLQAINNKIIKTKFFIGCDAGDVFFLEHPNIILDKFLNLKNKLDCSSVWGAEKNSHPNIKNLRWKHNAEADKEFLEAVKKDEIEKLNHKSPFAFLNSGCFIGDTSHIKNKYQEIKTNYDIDEKCDQYVMRIIQKKYHKEIILDNQAEIFLNLNKVDNYDIHFE